MYDDDDDDGDERLNSVDRTIPIPIDLTFSSSSRPTSSSSQSSANSPSVRIGHPSRPYYSAIRKQGISSRPLSSPPPRHLNEDHIEEPAPALPRKRSSSGPSSFIPKGFKITSHPAHSRVGFSVSGETELKIALAFSDAQSTLLSATATPTPKSVNESTTTTTTTTLADRVKKLGKSLRDLFFMTSSKTT